MICAKCESEVKGREKYMKCNGFCERVFHQACAGLTDTAFRVIAEKNNVFWSCDVCGIGKNCSLLKIFSEFQKTLTELSTEIKNQRKEIGNELKSLADSQEGIRASYADKVRAKKHEPVLVIKPKKDGQTSDKTREEVKRLIDPTEIRRVSAKEELLLDVKTMKQYPN